MASFVDRDWYRSSLGSALLCGDTENNAAERERRGLAAAYAHRNDATHADEGLDDGNRFIVDVQIRRSLSVSSHQYGKHRSMRLARGLISDTGADEPAENNDRAQHSESGSYTAGKREGYGTSSSGRSGAAELPLEYRTVPWYGCSLLPEWRVRLHGRAASGKSCIVDALCGRTDDRAYCETIGLEISSTVLPIKLHGEGWIRWICLTLEDAGARAQDQYSYLQHTPIQTLTKDGNGSHVAPVVDMYDAHLVVFSMTDKESLLLASKTIESLRQSVATAKILVVGTKVDAFQYHQVSEDDIHALCRTMQVPVCLVDSRGAITDTHSVYRIVEELTEMLLTDMLATEEE